jgi:hypothetical protein
MIISVKESLGMPQTGTHRAIVREIEETTSNSEHSTPQLKVVFVSTDPKDRWKISKWLNLRGYEHDDNGDVLYRDGKPVISKVNTDMALDILSKTCFRLGMKVGQNDAKDLIGLEGYIQVVPNPNKPSQTMIENIYSIEYAESHLV